MYAGQMEATIDAVLRHFPAETRLTTPRGGHVLWVQLPPGADAMNLYHAAARQGIRLAPGPMFSPSGGYQDFIRLNTGFPWTAATEQQVAALGRLAAPAAAERAGPASRRADGPLPAPRPADRPHRAPGTASRTSGA